MPTIKRLLVVDDDEDFADSVADLLASNELEVAVAYDGSEAVQKISAQPYDLTLLDVQMPGQNGVQSLIEILQLRPTSRVVMMTGYTIPALLDEAIASGASGSSKAAISALPPPE